MDRDPNRARAVVRRDAGRHAFARLDRDGERGAERRLVVLGHLVQAERVAVLAGEAEADQPARMRRHEVDRVGCRELRGDRRGRPRSRDRDRRRRRRSGRRECPRSPRRWSRTGSWSRLQSRRGWYPARDQAFDVLAEHVHLEVQLVALGDRAERRVLERVRDQRDAERLSSTCVTVSATPCTATEPFSTT